MKNKENMAKMAELVRKYRAYSPIKLDDRSWPNKTITKAPIWCSVDLRDGNQALMHPMNLQQKLDMFNLLVKIGFKEIEVGFPSASQVEYDFAQKLITENLIPDDVVIQVLTQSREHLIKKSFEAIHGAKRAVVHLYNSTSTLQRRVVFKMKQREIIELAVKGAHIIRQEAEKSDIDIRYEYSPESFTGTELDFAVEICEAVADEFGATPERPVILNLPATVEMATPNVYADQIELFSRKLKDRRRVIISLHAHNDRGTAVAATELALMAGADRVEGTLFGNGERTGNVDLVSLALNMFSQGVDPELDFSDIDHVANVYERCTNLDVHPRHPYAGKLVYTAFSGSHQDAINKGMEAYEKSKSGNWQVPYLPIDPEDLGRTYESIIRINSQSGKGGVAYIMDKMFGYKLPKDMHPEFGAVIQRITDNIDEELSSEEILKAFRREYLLATVPYEYKDFNINRHAEGGKAISAEIVVDDHVMKIEGVGNGPLDAFCNSILTGLGLRFDLKDYHQRAFNNSSSSEAISYVWIDSDSGEFWGVGQDSDIAISSIKAVLSALNRMSAQKEVV